MHKQDYCGFNVVFRSMYPLLARPLCDTNVRGPIQTVTGKFRVFTWPVRVLYYIIIAQVAAAISIVVDFDRANFGDSSYTSVAVCPGVSHIQYLLQTSRVSSNAFGDSGRTGIPAKSKGRHGRVIVLRQRDTSPTEFHYAIGRLNLVRHCRPQCFTCKNYLPAI